jgi:ribose transport system ATP-binding protein
MEEIFRIADKYSVLRNGKTVGAGQMKDIDEKELVKLMIEKESAFTFSRGETKANEKPVCLEVKDLRTDSLRGVSFSVREGELVGIGGLRGQGQRDLLLSLFGDVPYSGNVSLFGNESKLRHPREAMKLGLALVPGDRAREGLLYIRSILENLQLPSWARYGFPLKINKAKNDASQVGESLNLKMAGLGEPVSSLSGGNAQKVVLGKWLMRKPKLLLLDDPTKGVDVGTKAEFYALLTKLCSEGKTILFYSSDDEELVGLCDRVLVIYDGVIRTELTGVSLSKENLIAASLGVANGYGSEFQTGGAQ